MSVVGSRTMFDNLRRSWRRAKVMARAQAQGATTQEAETVADVLYPHPWTKRPDVVIFDQDGDQDDRQHPGYL